MKHLQERKHFDLSFYKEFQHILQKEVGYLLLQRVAFQQKMKLIRINIHAVILESKKSLSVVLFIPLIIVRRKRLGALIYFLL